MTKLKLKTQLGEKSIPCESIQNKKRDNLCDRNFLWKFKHTYMKKKVWVLKNLEKTKGGYNEGPNFRRFYIFGIATILAEL